MIQKKQQVLTNILILYIVDAVKSRHEPNTSPANWHVIIHIIQQIVLKFLIIFNS